MPIQGSFAGPEPIAIRRYLPLATAAGKDLALLSEVSRMFVLQTATELGQVLTYLADIASVDGLTHS